MNVNDKDWARIVDLLLELGALDFCVFGFDDEAADIVEHLIEIAVTESLK